MLISTRQARYAITRHGLCITPSYTSVTVLLHQRRDFSSFCDDDSPIIHGYQKSNHRSSLTSPLYCVTLAERTSTCEWIFPFARLGRPVCISHRECVFFSHESTNLHIPRPLGHLACNPALPIRLCTDVGTILRAITIVCHVRQAIPNRESTDAIRPHAQLGPLTVLTSQHFGG